MSGIAFILALIALVAAFAARRMALVLQSRLAAVHDELQALRAQVAALRLSLPEAPQAEPAPPEPTAAPPEAAPASPIGAAASSPAETPPADAAVPPAPPGAPTRPTAPPPGPAAAPAASLEERLGTRWTVWLGGLALALGGVLLVRYSIEAGLFGPGVRVALGAAFALLLIAAGEWFRRSERDSPVEGIPSAHIPGVLTAAGTISAFGTVYAAHALYHFIGPAAAFVLLGAIGVAAMLAAALHGPALAGLGLAGAYAVPLLIASQEPSPWPVVLYLAAVAAAAYALARLRRWLWLACAAVAGAIAWGFALMEPVSTGAAGPWALALAVHIGVQLALAAAFIAIEPHLTTDDADAAPDWIATLALAALTALVVRALREPIPHEQWLAFALAAIAILGVTAWRSAPAAGAAVLAGIVALAGIVLWPAAPMPVEAQYQFPALAQAPAELRVLTPLLEGLLRLPAGANMTPFMMFAAVAALAVGILATLRIWRGRALPIQTVGLYTLAAVVTPLLALVVAYLRITQFDRSIPFALLAVALAGVFYVIADLFDRSSPLQTRTAATRLIIGALASGVAAAMALAFTMALDRGYLTVAFAVAAFTTAIFAVVDRIPMLRYVVVALGLVVLGRLAWDPRIMGEAIGTWPILNWLLIGYGVPAAAFLGAGHLLKREGEDLAVRLCDAMGVLLAALLVYFQIRHALNGGDPFAPASGHVEQGLLAVMGIGFAAVLIRMDLAHANPVFRAASLIFGVVSAFLIVVGLVFAHNPLLSTEAVRGPVGFNTLSLAYLLPGLAAVVLTRIARGVRPRWYVVGTAAMALGLVLAYVSLEVRHAFQGELLTLGRDTSAPEVWSYSAAWLALGLVFLFYGLWRGVIEPRLASAALVVLAVLKVFLYDLTGIGGFWRAFSVICLGAVLIGIGLVYQKLVFARPVAPPAP
jgi:uncharacterized membrane protein